MFEEKEKTLSSKRFEKREQKDKEINNIFMEKKSS